MAWVRLQPEFHTDPKIRSAWYVYPGSIGLYVMALSYCRGSRRDDVVPIEFVEMLLPGEYERRRAVGALVFAELWREHVDGWSIRRPSRSRLPRPLRRLVLQRDGNVCRLCGGVVAPDDIHIDHILPKYHGGTDTLDNLQVAHAFCNLSKGARV